MQSRKTLIPLDKVEPNPGLSATVSARYAEAKKVSIQKPVFRMCGWKSDGMIHK